MVPTRWPTRVSRLGSRTTLSNSDTRPERVRQPRARASAQARVGPQVVLKEDYCTDDTVAVARRLMPTITVVANHRPGGKGNALQTGAEAATGDILVQLDADGFRGPREIHVFVGALLTGATTPRARGSSREAARATCRRCASGATGRSSPGCASCSRARSSPTSAPATTPIGSEWPLLDAGGFEIGAVMNLRAVRAGLRISEVPSYETERIHGEGKLVARERRSTRLPEVPRRRPSLDEASRSANGSPLDAGETTR